MRFKMPARALGAMLVLNAAQALKLPRAKGGPRPETDSDDTQDNLGGDPVKRKNKAAFDNTPTDDGVMPDAVSETGGGDGDSDQATAASGYEDSKKVKKGQKASVANQFQAVTINLKGPQIREEMLEGEKYMVVPCVMLTEGVHNGSGGPLLYPPDELGKTPVVWNHKPVVVYHPEHNGQGISACDPTVINTRKIGLIMNTFYKGSKLHAEAWLKRNRVAKVDKRILNSLDKGEMVELSTGLFTDNEQAQGVWKGEEYVAIARNYRPDHLAILPDEVGACSIEDGAGLFRNKEGGVTGNEVSFDQRRDLLQTALRKKSNGGMYSGPYVNDIFDKYCIYSDQGCLYKQNYTCSDTRAKLQGEPAEVRKVVQYQDAEDGEILGNAVEEQVIENEWTDEDREKYKAQKGGKNATRKGHAEATAESFNVGVSHKDGKSHVLMDTGSHSQIQEVKDHLQDSGFVHKGGGEYAHSDGTKATFQPKKQDQNRLTFHSEKQEGSSMGRQALVTALILSAETAWQESDRAFLMRLNQRHFDLVTANGPAVVDTGGEESGGSAVWEEDVAEGGKGGGARGGGNEKTKPKKRTPADLMGNAAGDDSDEDDDSKDDEDDDMTNKGKGKKRAKKPTGNSAENALTHYVNNAPREIRELLTAGVRKISKERTQLTNKILGNSRNRFTQEQLAVKSLDEIQALAELAGDENDEPSGVVNYQGLGETFTSPDDLLENAEGEEQEVLGLPSTLVANKQVPQKGKRGR